MGVGASRGRGACCCITREHACAHVLQGGLSGRPRSLPPPAGLHEGERPWLAKVVVAPPAALPSVPAGAPPRLRPLIYVYDMPPRFHSQILQYRLDP
jgi:hypothetical protein